MHAMDAFHGYFSDRIRNRLREKNADLVLIPSGMTNQSHPLNGPINKPFEHLVHKAMTPA
jgi:hypothetical protein